MACSTIFDHLEKATSSLDEAQAVLVMLLGEGKSGEFELNHNVVLAALGAVASLITQGQVALAALPQ